MFAVSVGAACWCGGHRGVGAGLVGAGALSGTEGGLEGLVGSGASSCPTHTKQGPREWWEPGDPLLSPQCIQWALSSPINRLPGVRGIELPDLCLAGLPPLPPSWALWGQGLAGLLAPDSPCGCRGDRFRLGHSPCSCPSLPPSCSPQGWLLHSTNQPPPPGAEPAPLPLPHVQGSPGAVPQRSRCTAC